MDIILYFFNYDLTNKVVDSNTAPEGYYSSVTIDDTNIKHMYYHGVDDDGLQLKKNIENLSSFTLTENMSVFKY